MNAQEVLTKFPHEHTVKDVVAARKWLSTVRENPYNGVFASFKDGKMVKQITNGACHGSIVSTAPSSVLIANSTKGIIEKGLPLVTYNVPLAERWFDWLLNSSYYAPFYVNTSVEDAITSGLLVPSTLPANLMQGNNIITRHNHEKASYIEAWGTFVDVGVSPDVAYLIAFGFGVSQTHLSLPETKLGLQPPGHNAITFPSPAAVKGFLNGEYNNLLEPYSKKTNDKYYGYGLSSVILHPQGKEEVCSHPKLGDYKKALFKFLSTFVEKPVVSTISSPFAKKPLPIYDPISGMYFSSSVQYPDSRTLLKYVKEFEKFLTTEYLNV